MADIVFFITCFLLDAATVAVVRAASTALLCCSGPSGLGVGLHVAGLHAGPCSSRYHHHYLRCCKARHGQDLDKRYERLVWSRPRKHIYKRLSTAWPGLTVGSVLQRWAGGGRLLVPRHKAPACCLTAANLLRTHGQSGEIATFSLPKDLGSPGGADPLA